MLLVEPQNSEEAELNFMVICLPVSIFHGSSWKSGDHNLFHINMFPLGKRWVKGRVRQVFGYTVYRGFLNRVWGILQLKYGYSVYDFL